MAWGNSNQNPDGLPAISDYAHAVALFHKREPYKRGEKKGERPLGAVRRYNRSLIHMHPLLDDKVSCSYYGTHVVSFHKDGRIELCTGGYPSMSTLRFMQFILRHTHKFIRKHNKIYYCDAKEHQYFCLPSCDSLFLHPDGRVEGAVEEATHALDKALMRELRKQYSEFMRYGYDMLTIDQDVLIDEDQQRSVPTVDKRVIKWDRSTTHPLKRMQFFDALNFAAKQDDDAKLEQYFALLRRIGWAAGHRAFVNGRYSEFRRCSPTQFKKAMDILIKLQYADKLFIKQQASKSKPVLDSNDFYVTFGNRSTQSN